MSKWKSSFTQIWHYHVNNSPESAGLLFLKVVQVCNIIGQNHTTWVAKPFKPKSSLNQLPSAWKNTQPYIPRPPRVSLYTQVAVEYQFASLLRNTIKTFKKWWTVFWRKTTSTPLETDNERLGQMFMGRSLLLKLHSRSWLFVADSDRFLDKKK